MAIIPDEKDWTWILDRPCPECLFDVTALNLELMPVLVRDLSRAWQQVLLSPTVAVRPSPDTWSPLEYACHVRDVFSLFATRLSAMIETDGAKSLNWDQDQAAIEGNYAAQDPMVVSSGLGEAGEQLALQFARVSGSLWDHRGLRSNGSEFTIRTFAQYFAHDPIHHLVDVESPDANTFTQGIPTHS